MSEEHEEPKLIIDEDWKTQVQREKEEFEKQKNAPAEEPASVDVKQSTDAGAAPAEQLPPATLPMLIASLGTQAMAALGQIPDDNGQPMPVHLDFAKHFIDLIGVLEEKTKGNLTPEEAHYLQDSLYQLRLAFVDVKKRQG